MKFTEIPTESPTSQQFLPADLKIDEAILSHNGKVLYIPYATGDELKGWMRVYPGERCVVDTHPYKSVVGKRVKLLGVSYTCST